eukprot:TRINITY_DN16738_c0_g1_i2.p1 TRINITY_DN16738_c0_g1~~TRINITY_DN16738_c0_g1_i2.p1  ORF type:complete len:110 (-),score=19.75 TRINITY_DN16738_c0_g1_i2:8-301(-)
MSPAFINIVVPLLLNVQGLESRYYPNPDELGYLWPAAFGLSSCAVIPALFRFRPPYFQAGMILHAANVLVQSSVASRKYTFDKDMKQIEEEERMAHT